MNLKQAAVLAGWLLLGSGAAQAAVTCTFGASPGFTISNYVEGVASSIATNVTVNCNRGTTTDPATVNYTVAFDSGLNANRASAVVSGTTYYLSYSKAATTACAPAITTLTGALTWPTTGPAASRTGPLSSTANYVGCVSAQTGMAAATYTDSIGLTVTHDAGAGTASTSAPVSITVPPVCTLTVPTPVLNFSYTAFRATTLTVNLPFNTTCTKTAPFTMALDVTTGVVAGLAYSLALSAPGATGTGISQTYNIIGTMAAGQPGDCTGSCTTPSNSHNLTVSY